MAKKTQKCPRCHHVINDKMNFCPICGYSLDDKKENVHLQHHKSHNTVHTYKRMQHTKIKQPSPLKALKFKCQEWKHKIIDGSDNNLNQAKSANTENSANKSSTSLASSLHYNNVRIIGISVIIIVLIIILAMICLRDGSSTKNNVQPISRSNHSVKINHVASRYKYPVNHIWSAMQADLDNRAVSKPYARYFVNGRHNTAYTSLVSWKAEIFNSTPNNNLNGIRTKPENFVLKKHHLLYTVKYEFPQNDNSIQIQKYRWHADIQGHRIFSMYSDSNPISTKIESK